MFILSAVEIWMDVSASVRLSDPQGSRWAQLWGGFSLDWEEEQAGTKAGSPANMVGDDWT